MLKVICGDEILVSFWYITVGGGDGLPSPTIGTLSHWSANAGKPGRSQAWLRRGLGVASWFAQ